MDGWPGAAVHGLGMAMNFIATLTLMTQLAEAGGGSQETVHGLASSIWITCESLGGCRGEKRDGREDVNSTFVQVEWWARRGAGRAMTGWAGCGAACWWRGCRRPPWWPWSRSASPPPSPAAAPGAGRRDCCRAPPSRATAPSTTTSSVCRTVVLLPGVSSLCHTVNIVLFSSIHLYFIFTVHFIFCTIPSSHCFFAYNKFYWVYSWFKVFELILSKSLMLRSSSRSSSASSDVSSLSVFPHQDPEHWSSNYALSKILSRWFICICG